MLRKLHTLPGLMIALLLTVTLGTGAILAFDAAWEARFPAPAAHDVLPLAEVADRIAARFADVEKIIRSPSGKLRVIYFDHGAPKMTIVDPMTGETIDTDQPSATYRTILNLHRAWLAGDGGRAVAGFSALAMLALSLSGLLLLRRNLGSWAALIRPLGGFGARRWHLELGRLAAAGLLISALSGVHLSLVGFELVPDGVSQNDSIATGGGQRLPLSKLAGFEGLTLADLRELTLPYGPDATDPVIIKTDRAIRYIDQATGSIMLNELHSFAWHLRDLAYRLHTAQGIVGLALMLGLSALAGVGMAGTGVFTWLKKHRRSAGITNNTTPEQADTVILVGSEGQTTWGFAHALHGALVRAGRKVHLAAMNDLPTRLPSAGHLFILTATAADGEAPASATHFLSKLTEWRARGRPFATVLGFGDRQFPRFCAFAAEVERAMTEKGFPLGLALTRIDRQSDEAFEAWGTNLGAFLQIPLNLKRTATPSADHRFQLVEREDYGAGVQAPTAILRFRVISRAAWLPRLLTEKLRLAPKFEAGDLVAICPPGESRPRLYSLASASCSGILEICVRKVSGGACSSYLHSLALGDTLSASIRPNPAFRPDGSGNPLVLIGAGAGIAPLVGFVRTVGNQRPVHLYWGGRNPDSDFLYREELDVHVLEGRITGLRTTFSRIGKGRYVQTLLTADVALLTTLLQAGAQILVCGSTDMARGVHDALCPILAPLGLDLIALRQAGRLIEDVY